MTEEKKDHIHKKGEKEPHKVAAHEKANAKEERKANPIAILAIILVLIVAVAAAIIYVPGIISDNQNSAQYSDGTNKAVYNYYVFDKNDDQKWYLEFNIRDQPYVIPFYYNPFQAENVSIDNNTMPAISDFQNLDAPKIMYISIDPLASSKVAVAAFEIKRILDTNYGIFNFDVRYGIHYLHLANFTEYPVATCKDARPDRIIMVLNVTDYDAIYTQNNCVHVDASSDDELIRVADALSYRLLGIIQYSTVHRDSNP